MTEELTAQVDSAVEELLAEKAEVSDVKEEVREEVDVNEEVKEEVKEEVSEEVKEEVKSEAKEEVKEEVKIVTPSISDSALASAIRAGLTYSEAKGFASEESLMRIVSVIESAKEKPEQKKEEDDPFAKIPKMDPEKYEPEVIEMFNSLLDVVKKQNQELKEIKNQTSEQVKQFSTGRKEEAAREATKWFDGKISELGDDFHEVLGKGSYDSLQRGSLQHAKRDEIASQIAVLVAGYNASGITAPSRDELFSRAARLVLQDEYQRVKEKELSEKLSKRSTQHIQRVSGKNVSSRGGDPLEDTAKFLNEKYFAKT